MNDREGDWAHPIAEPQNRVKKDGEPSRSGAGSAFPQGKKPHEKEEKDSHPEEGNEILVKLSQNTNAPWETRKS